MATFTVIKTITTTYDIVIPAAEPHGADMAELGKALSYARQELVRIGEIATLNDPLPDDRVTLRPGDDSVIIRLVTSTVVDR